MFVALIFLINTLTFEIITCLVGLFIPVRQVLLLLTVLFSTVSNSEKQLTAELMTR